jgi:acyl dehydratase
LTAPGGSRGSGVRYDDARIGDAIETSLTVTETHLVLGAGLIGDFNPHHVDEGYARASRYGGRILHGMLTSAIMGAPLGMWFHGTAIGYLEHHVRFLAPVYPGDTLTTRWRIVEKIDKPKHAGGIVVVHGECRNQDGTVVASAEAKMLAGNAHDPGAPAASVSA